MSQTAPPNKARFGGVRVVHGLCTHITPLESGGEGNVLIRA